MATRARRAASGPRKRGPLTGYWGVTGRPRVYTTEQLREAIVEAGGNMTRAAALLRCDVETLRRRRAREPELDRAIAVLKSLSAKQTFARRQRRERAQVREREALGLRPGVSAAAPLPPAPRVVVEYGEEPSGLIQRVEDVEVPTVDAPPMVGPPGASPGAGRRHPDLPWMDPHWPLVRILAPVESKHHGRLAVGDSLRVPPRVAAGWIGAGAAAPVAQEDVRR